MVRQELPGCIVWGKAAWMEPLSKAAGICFCAAFGCLSSAAGFFSSSKWPRGVLAQWVLSVDELQIAEVIQLVLGGVTQLLFSAAFAYIHLECQFTALWDLIRNGLSPFSLKPNLNCYRYFPYHPCSHVLGTAYIAIKVCISFLLSKDNLPPLPRAMESCRWVWSSDSCAFHTHCSPWKSWEVVDWPSGPRGLVVGETCPMQPGWVGVLALCVPGWSNSSWECCRRLSKEKRLFSSHKGNNQIVSLLPFPSVRQNIVNLGVGTQWRIFWFSTMCLPLWLQFLSHPLGMFSPDIFSLTRTHFCFCQRKHWN